MATLVALPEAVEAFRDQYWRREPEHRIESYQDAVAFVDHVGFCNAMTDSRRPGPSLYIAVCGRRDAHLPRNVQKDTECRSTWYLKDELLRRGRVYYAKLVKGRTLFVKPSLVPYFNALWGVPKKQESVGLSEAAQAILAVLRHEWEMGTRDLREASGVAERAQFNKAIDELQKTFKVVPSEVLYKPTFTYIWALAEGRFPAELRERVKREVALKEIARSYLRSAGLTMSGELARATGLSRVDAGLGNWALVDEGFAVRDAPGVYRLADFDLRLNRA